MGYPKENGLTRLSNHINDYAKLKHEYGAKGIEELLERAEHVLSSFLDEMKQLPIDAQLAKNEPDSLEEIKVLRNHGPRKMWDTIGAQYVDKLEGAMLARFAGCTLGAPVEFWSIEAMKKWAEYINFDFPPKAYWPSIKSPNDLRYQVSPFEAYTSAKMDGVPVDDDITYTILGMLIAEDYGVDFTSEDVGTAWVKYLPYACTAEEAALKNLQEGVTALEAADKNNPFCQWLGADIRCDPWAYMAPAWPEKAAELAYRDAVISHRRNGIYGAMFFAATQSAAFAVDNAVDAIKIGLTEIPKYCMLYEDVTWALNEGKNISNYKQARQAIDERFAGMSGVHTNNNAALTVFGLMIGGNDVTRVLGEIVAMGLDNDCTAATAGSIVGAIVGKSGIPTHWYKAFNNKVRTYLIGTQDFQIDNLVERFALLANKLQNMGVTK